MPFCTGVEVTRALRQIPEYQSLPVIYLSGETDIGQQVEALRLGGDQFLTAGQPDHPQRRGQDQDRALPRHAALRPPRQPDRPAQPLGLQGTAGADAAPHPRAGHLAVA